MRTPFLSRALPGLAALILGLAATHPVAAQPFPDRPIRLTVGFPPGTGPDVLARLVGQRLGEVVHQPVVIENKAGAGGQIAAQLVARGSRDGYNLLLGEAGSVSIAPAAFEKLPYNPARDLVGVAELAWADFVLVVPASSPYRSLAQLVAAQKGGRDALNLATFGAGSPGHFGAMAFAARAGVKVEPVHFRSTGDAVAAIVSAQVQGAWVSTALASAQIRGGAMRGLAMTGASRSPLIPDVPTVAEAGMPDLRFSSWLGILAPSDTPGPALKVLNQRLNEVIQAPDIRRQLVEAGFAVSGAGLDETDKMLKAEARKWADIVQASGFKGN